MGKNFILLNAIQFFDALNENLLKYLIAYFLIFHQGAANSSVIMSMTGAAFILPFIFFSPVGGVLADRFSKTRVILITRFFHVAAMAAVFVFSLFFNNDFIYLLLFLACSVAAIFGPAKYGVIAELVPKQDLVRANGYVAGFTYFGIILGTALASILDTLADSWMFLSCVGVALLGTLLSFMMDKTPVMNPHKQWPKFIYKEIFDALKEMYRIPHMITAVFCYGYFIFLGAFIQMNIIPYSISILGVKPTIGGYLFLFTSVGVGFGCLIAGRLSGSLRGLPWYNLGMSLGCFFFMLFPFPIWLNIIWLTLVGIAGGFFLVPPQAYIVTHSPPETKGRNFGVANLLSFAFALIAAGALYLLSEIVGFDPAQSFAAIGILNVGVSILLFFLTRQKSLVH